MVSGRVVMLAEPEGAASGPRNLVEKIAVLNEEVKR